MLTINNTLDGYLKDVEIKGNTIQDAENLADIRSVGDKVEGQELYEIPVVSVGKNLINPNNCQLNFFYNGDYTNEKDFICTEVKVKANITYILNDTDTYLCLLDSNRKYIPNSFKTSSSGDYKLITPNSDGFLLMRTNANLSSGSCQYTSLEHFISKIQLEEGTVATPYEPYIEDKLTILSPVQLEKVGDVADRIICKNGVWGVEKNVGEYILNYNKILELNTNFTTINRIRLLDNMEFKPINLGGKSLINTYGLKFAWNDNDEPHWYVENNTVSIYILKNLVPTIEDAKKYFKENEFKAYMQLNTPQFIPLPHDQQVKLRTFANKTNISFGCEIEGTIKAQVPKSLGATVNTHTEQIRSLNNELNRVKKLEESTVSTVETESDFTTVEATNGGYFEDVKLEGKTLVNLANNSNNIPNPNINHNVIHPMILDVRNKNYTLVIKLNTSKQLNCKYAYTDGTLGNDFKFCDANVNGVVTKLITPNMLPIDFDKEVNGFRLSVVGGTPLDVTIDYIEFLEGDHTQNPPSYFEGLKSVGQSASEDGVDEVSVESVKGDGNLFDKDNVNKLSKMWFHKNGVIQKDVYESLYWIRIEPSTTYTIQKMPSYRGRCGFSKNKPALGVQVRAVASHDGTFPMKVTSMSDENYLLISGYCDDNYDKNITEEELLSSIQINKGDTLKPYTPYQSDKKRLLYYNEETQAWEKPILREWDSIEKHSDGKYYYHQRSGEVVLNGSEDWEDFDENSFVNRQFFKDAMGNTTDTDTNKAICNRFVFGKVLVDTNRWQYYNHLQNVWSMFAKKTGQTLEQFKSELQANNVTVVYQLAQEKVHECTNIDLITYANETNYIVESGAVAPKSTLKVHNNISNVVSLLQKKVSLLENNITSYMITQNRLMLASRYNADTVSFKVDVASLRDTFEYDNDLYELILNNILVGKDNYNREYIENLIIFYWMDFVISDEMYSTLFEIIEEQHNPKIEEETSLI